MALFVLPQLLAVLLWIGSTFTENPIGGTWLFPLLIATHAGMGAWVLTLGRADAEASVTTRRWPLLLLLLFPVTAPATMCLLSAGVTFRAGMRWKDNEEARRDLLTLMQRWRALGALGTGMGIVLAWSYIETLLEPVGAGVHPWSDPLTAIRSRLDVAPKILLIAVSLYYFKLLGTTIKVMALHRGLWREAAEPATPRE